MESMTNAPYFIPKARGGMRMGHGEIKDHMMSDGLEDAYDNKAMGCFAQDAWDEIRECWQSVQNLKKKLSTGERLDHSVSKGKILKTLCCSLGLGPISAWLHTIIKKRGNIRATR